MLPVALSFSSFPPPCPPQPAAVEEGGRRFSLVRALSKALVASPLQPAPLLFLLRTHLRSGDHAACADDFLRHWAKVRGYRASLATGSSVEESAREQERHGKPLGIEGGSSPEGFGDGWAWDLWRGRDANAASKVAHVAAECFATVGRLVDLLLFCPLFWIPGAPKVVFSGG